MRAKNGARCRATWWRADRGLGAPRRPESIPPFATHRPMAVETYFCFCIDVPIVPILADPPSMGIFEPALRFSPCDLH